ncbi:mandelate racemase [Rhizobium sp. AB2/73]|uniref:mandelate racemase n=1 Tax=Rhizobium sp. AB2/73 TaxID=2795216 RepID=UPI000DE17510|nr:mandelate racemase [Rhizobium sp. AB2/73]QYA13799.1 mandelate racemase [Rhizobium sp. AB2/73]UEQ80270.1 mandelate racemase [Rhizobium sp. AB2/73]
MTEPLTIRLVEAETFERPVKLRLPFRFGAATLREARQIFLRVRIEDAQGRSAEGMAAELMVPKWFDKSPELSNADNENQLRRSLALALDSLGGAGAGTAFGLHAAVEASHHAQAAAEKLNGLVASFGLALANRAILDALCRLEGLTVAQAIKANRPGIDASTARDLAGFDLSGFLVSLQPSASLAARHTVGLVDAIVPGDIPASERLNDGLPESFEEAIDAYGLTFFKVKVSGVPDADIDRLCRVADVIDAKVPNYSVTLDGNEQFSSAEAVADLLSRVKAESRLARFAASILFVEQPIARVHAFEKPVKTLAAFKPVEIDESDADIDAFVTAKGLGYTGISSKSCKGFYRSLLNRARVAKWSAEDGIPYFMSAEDLTTQGGLAVQQDLALASLIGMTHIERNGHHYVDGMAGAPEAEQAAFAEVHSDLYRISNGRTRLRIEGGQLAIGSVIGAVGLGSSVAPDWAAMERSPA